MFARMLRALKLDSSVYEEVEHDQTATGQAMAVVVLTSVIGSLGAFFGPGGLKLVLTAALGGLVGWVVMAFLSLVLGKLFGGKADMGEVLRALGFASTPRILGIIPIIGGIVGFILGVIAWVQALRASLDLSTGLAIVVAILSVIAYLAVAFALALVFGVGGALLGG